MGRTIAGNWHGVGTQKTYQRLAAERGEPLRTTMLDHVYPFRILLCFPLSEFQLVVWTTIMPKMEEGLELRVLKIMRLHNMETHQSGCHREAEHTTGPLQHSKVMRRSTKDRAEKKTNCCGSKPKLASPHRENKEKF